jgi:hypothetical protein
VNTHPTKRLAAPDGSRPAIDVMIAPLIRALWDAGYETIGSCQDLGESLAGYGRKSTYWGGYVLLEMPAKDACRLLDAVKGTPQFCGNMHWAAPGAWEVSLPVMPFSMFDTRGEDDAVVAPWAQVHFPNDQIDDLVSVLTADGPS